jgi:hypothetical protein
MRVRFGFQYQVTNAPLIASWNLDDVIVANQPCP